MQEAGIGTKAKIFNASLRMFASEGVENTTIRAIADAANIKNASIYNHYKSKEHILDECYKFFNAYRDECRLTKAQYLRVLQDGTKEEIINIPNYSMPEDKAENLIFALIVTLSRIHIDTKARDCYTAIKREAMAYLREVFETGIEIGRFEPFDLYPVSLLFLSIKLGAAHSVSIDPQNSGHLIEEQAKMLHLLIGIIPFRY